MFKKNGEIQDNVELVAQIKETFSSIAGMAAVPLGGGSVLVPISLSKTYTREEIGALVNLSQPSKKILVLVTGLLYRHTFPLTETRITDLDAYNKCLEIAEKWQDDMLEIFNESRTQVVIHRWHDWLLHHTYPDVRKKIEDRYISDTTFRAIFDDEADAFLKRLESKCKIEDLFKARSACLDYLKEECAVCVVVKGASHFAHLLYGGSISKTLAATFNLFNQEVFMMTTEFTKRMATKVVKYESDLRSDMTAQDLRRNVLKIDMEVAYLRERSKVLINCKVVVLEKASSCVRNEVAKKIVAIIQDKNNLRLTTVSGFKSTILIFSPVEMNIEVSNDAETLAKFQPTKLAKKFTPLNEEEILEIFEFDDQRPSQHRINLKCLENQKLQKCKELTHKIVSEQQSIKINNALLENLLEVFEFAYSRWASMEHAPEVEFLIINDTIQIKLSGSKPDKITEQTDTLDKVLDVLENLAGSKTNQRLFSKQMTGGIHSISTILVRDPLGLAHIFNESFLISDSPVIRLCREDKFGKSEESSDFSESSHFSESSNFSVSSYFNDSQSSRSYDFYTDDSALKTGRIRSGSALSGCVSLESVPSLKPANKRRMQRYVHKLEQKLSLPMHSDDDKLEQKLSHAVNKPLTPLFFTFNKVQPLILAAGAVGIVGSLFYSHYTNKL